jgi:primosomal protein N' (replication factor Y)
MRVTVPLGSKKTYTALILKVHNQTPQTYEVKNLLHVIDSEPVVLESQLFLWQWISEYYMCPPGDVFKAAMPAQLDLYRKLRKKTVPEANENRLSELNEPQKQALAEIKASFEKTGVTLLHGVTSSGKTEIYIHLIREALDQNKQVLYLLPEIALTAQIIKRLRTAFGNRVVVYHSKYSNADRIRTWKNLLEYDPDSPDAHNVGIVLGVRSAIFLPFKNPGLIIIDEEHENTYKQYDPSPRYHARDTAIMMAKHHGAKVLLGTATPSIETYHNCVTGKFGLVELNERYQQIQLPEVKVENIRDLRRKKRMQSHFSPALLDGIGEALQNKEQVILFQNRRGFSLFLECDKCGEVPKCKRCDVSLTYHKKQNRLYCHYCGYGIPVPNRCPACTEGDLKLKGFGTEKIEEEIAIFFPEAKIERLDLDAAASRKSYEQLIARFAAGESDILVGTQMVSKGLDFDNVSLVGIMDADTMLNYPDFRAHERSYQLMAQVSGRAGRKNKRGKVIIQASSGDHLIIADVVKNDYKGMFSRQAEERRRFSYPPYSRLIEITLKHRNMQTVSQAGEWLAEALRKQVTEKILGPEFPLIPRIRNQYLKSMLIKIEKSVNLVVTKKLVTEALLMMKTRDDFRSVQYTLDVDPY